MTRARQQYSFMAGTAALLAVLLLTFNYAAVHLVGYSIYLRDNEFENLLWAVSQHKLLWEASALSQAITAACLVPIGLALFNAFDDERPYALLAICFLFIGVGLLVDSYGHYGNMVGLGMDIANHRAPVDELIKLADTLGDQFEIIQYGGLAGFGASMLIFSILMARSEFFPSPLSWLTFAVGIVAFFFTAMPILFVVTRFVWCLSMGVFWLADSQAVVAEEPEVA